MASISGYIAQTQRWTYSGTKGAILSMTRCMAMDLREKEIRVNSISPAWVWTPEVRPITESSLQTKFDVSCTKYHQFLIVALILTSLLCFIDANEKLLYLS